MEYDTLKTFREIHGTPSVLAAELDRIQGLALRRSAKPHQEELPVRLRFLTPLDPQPQDHRLDTVHLRLTSPQEYTKTRKYVAVSYTWQQSRSLISASSGRIPDYKIWDADNQPGHPKCNPLVVHRAYRFAQTKLKRVLIWIDQECIQQNDPDEVEAHLIAMHEIYRRSAFTVVLLSHMIDSVPIAAGLYPFMHGGGDIFDKLLRSDDCRDRKLCLVALQLLAEDRWFSRTWTYQERFFAAACHYAVPLSPALGINTQGTGLQDWYLPERNIVAFSEKCKGNALAINKDHFEIDLRPSSKGMCPCTMVNLSLMRLVKFRFEASRSINHKIHFPGFENFVIKSVSISTPREAIRASSKISATEQETNRIQGRFETINHVFSDMEACDNAVVADRVSVFANVCQLGWTLPTVRLRDEKISYSTCILALLLLDVLKIHGQAALTGVAERAMRLSIGDFIRNEGYPFSKSIEHYG